MAGQRGAPRTGRREAVDRVRMRCSPLLPYACAAAGLLGCGLGVLCGCAALWEEARPCVEGVWWQQEEVGLGTGEAAVGLDGCVVLSV